ncbi:MAG: DUF5107 domain-containing protein [Bacteroidales bacterium]|nr:DUF5107 domain-containing protein [Bacteroidales bacterium]
MVKAWKEEVVIPTYRPGAPEKNPIFLENRVYQGSSGRVYPYPVIESIADEKTDVAYQAIFLENEYIKVMVLPELGGRIQMAYDKLRQRHFIYYNHVIKPALVGLAGPWISGGIEFNWPQHHRPSTYTPVDSTIVENQDGSITVWVGERERMTHQKGNAGFTLRPGHAYIEIEGVVSNPTPMPQTFLWWANPAVAVNDHYQSVFPPDINAVFDHGKRAVSSFPIATGTYYKMDYSAGVDISNYRNIKVPTSYMGVNSRYDFEGGYENDTQAGMLHVANHHVSPGKKQWTWGNGDFGQAWDRNLTDEDGPYIELMAGMFTENQPDFTWLMPYEEKEFKQYFMPYRELGVVKNASKDLLLNITPAGSGKVNLKIFATSAIKATILLTADSGETIYSQAANLSPEIIFDEVISVGDAKMNQLNVEIVGQNGKTLLSWHAEPDEVRPIPDAAEAALQPDEIKTTEQLFLTGQHLEQYRHATFSPVDYYQEALRRDPNDVRCNNALGLWLLRNGRFDLAERYLLHAVKVITKRNPNPYDSEPIFNLGTCLKFQGRIDEAYDRFYKSTWSAAWQDAGFLECARISVMQERWEDALHELDRSLIRNWHNHTARTLKADVLRRMGRTADALALIIDSLAIDPFNHGCLYECYLISGADADLKALQDAMRGDANDYDQLALDYLNAGLWQEALDLWKMAIEQGATTPLTRYYMALCLSSMGQADAAKEMLAEAAAVAPDFGFPNRLEAILALRLAMELNPADARAPYYLGNLYYDKRQHALAIELWEQSAQLDPEFPTVWRNLALGYYNKQHQPDRALEAMERAFSLDPTDGRILMELDQLHKRMGHSHAERLQRLDQHPELVAQRDDLRLEHITLLNLTGQYGKAKAELDSHIFHPWEGGEGKVPAQYQYCRVELAKEALLQGEPEQAAALLRECLEYPHHLGEGKLYGALENDFMYLLGLSYQAMGQEDEARRYWAQGTVAPMQPAAALYYNDAAPDKLFYAALCERALGNEDKARSRFNQLVAYGEKHIFDVAKPDYFAVSLPDLMVWDGSIDEANRIHCLYMMALGHYGLGHDDKAEAFQAQALALNPNHIGLHAFASFTELSFSPAPQAAY